MKKHSRRRRIIFWILVSLGSLLLMVGVLLLVTNMVIISGAKDHIVRSPEEAPHAQCAIVLGARVTADGTPFPMLADRLTTGIRLYELGKVDKLLLSGDHGQNSYDEVNAMLDYAVSQGVPAEDIFTDHAGFDTYDTMYRARDVFLVESAIVVTQRYHLSRAIYIARTLGLHAIGVQADLQTYKHPVRNEAREVLARVKAVMQLHVTHAKPKYLGPVIPITGDGTATRG